MRCTVYKSLDKPSSLFGLKGGYLNFAIVGGCVAAAIGFIVGALTIGIFGFVAFVVALAIDYIAVMAFQAKFSEREKDRWLCSRSIPQYIIVAPKRFSRYLRH